MLKNEPHSNRRIKSMNLREIQALHAQYATPTGVIDLAGKISRLPPPMLLASPPAKRMAANSALSWVWKVALVGIGAAVVAFGGMQAAKVWQKVHFQPTKAISSAAKPAPMPAKMAIAPPSAPAPLASAELGSPSQTAAVLSPAADSLAHVNTTQLVLEHSASTMGNLPKKADTAVMSAPVIQHQATNTKVEKVDVAPPSSTATLDSRPTRPEANLTPSHHPWRARLTHATPPTTSATNLPTAAPMVRPAEHSVPSAHARGDVALF